MLCDAFLCCYIRKTRLMLNSSDDILYCTASFYGMIIHLRSCWHNIDTWIRTWLKELLYKDINFLSWPYWNIISRQVQLSIVTFQTIVRLRGTILTILIYIVLSETQLWFRIWQSSQSDKKLCLHYTVYSRHYIVYYTDHSVLYQEQWEWKHKRENWYRF